MADRPDPDQLLKRVQREESSRGRLKLFFGATAGVGKTYAMLEAARQRKREGWDVVIGVVETHGRVETAALLEGLEVLPRKQVDYKGVRLQEFDLDAALARRPKLLLVDELAHSNAPGSRHAKRWQDVEELLDSGIDVYTTLNVQHWESLNDVVAQITGIIVRETVPDTFLEQAHDIELVDLPPEDLLARLREGKVYLGEAAEKAKQHFFQPGNLIALRELALRHTAERVDAQVQAYKADQSIRAVWPVAERLVVGVTASPMSARLVRAAHRLATRLRCDWVAVSVETPESSRMSPGDRARLLETTRLAERLGAEIVSLTGHDVPSAIVDFARSRNASKIILGKPHRSRFHELLFGSVVNEIARKSGDIDLYVISGTGATAKPRASEGRAAAPEPWLEWLWALAAVAACTGVSWVLAPHMDRTNLLMVYLLGIMWVSYYASRGPAVGTAVLSVLAFDFFFVPPVFSFAVSDSAYLLTFAVMLWAGLLISSTTWRLKRQSELAIGREARTRALYRLSRELSEEPDSRQVAIKAQRHLEEFYRTPVVLLMPDDGGPLRPAAGSPDKLGFDEKEEAVARWVFDRGQTAGAGTDTLNASKGLYLPLKGLQRSVGVLALRPNENVSAGDPDKMRLLETFASEIGGALASTQLSESAGRAEAQVEVEKMRNLVWSEFSMNLDEPLSEVSRVTQQLMDQTPSLPETVKRKLSEIRDKAAHLGTVARDLPQIIQSRVRGRAPAPAPAVDGKVRLTDALTPQNVRIFKGRPTKEEALSELVGALGLPGSKDILHQVLERERSGSTIVGQGLAIPHARVPGLDRVHAALGIVPEGVKAYSAERKVVKVILLFVVPAERLGEHLAFLAAISSCFRGRGLTAELARAAGAEDALARLREVEISAVP